MLYYIVPPIIIIISASALIYFLFKKSQNVSIVEVGENGGSEEIKESKIERFKESVNHIWLKVLERLMHRAKLISLKFHNISNERFHAIRKKRQEIVEQEKEEISEQENAVVVQERNVEDDVNLKKDEVKPLIRKGVTHPDIRKSNVISKNQMEDALIKRIAINPRDIEAYERLGDYYMEMNNQRDSLECFRQVLKLNPKHHKAKLRVRRIEKAMEEQK